MLALTKFSLICIGRNDCVKFKVIQKYLVLGFPVLVEDPQPRQPQRPQPKPKRPQPLELPATLCPATLLPPVLGPGTGTGTPASGLTRGWACLNPPCRRFCGCCCGCCGRPSCETAAAAPIRSSGWRCGFCVCCRFPCPCAGGCCCFCLCCFCRRACGLCALVGRAWIWILV
jgi:hypothetical protein